MGKIVCLVILSYILVLSFTKIRETQAFAAGLRYGKRTLLSGGPKLEESDPNEQLEQGIGKSDHSVPWHTFENFKQAGMWRRQKKKHFGDFFFFFWCTNFFRTNAVRNVWKLERRIYISRLLIRKGLSRNSKVLKNSEQWLISRF